MAALTMLGEPVLTIDAAATAHVQVRAWVQRGSAFRGWASAHAGVELSWVDAGRLGYRIGSQELYVSAGQVVVIPREVEHTTDFFHSAQVRSLRLSGEMLAEVADAMCRGGLAGRLTAGVLADGDRIIRLGRLLHEELTHPGGTELLALETLSETLAVEVLRSDLARPGNLNGNDPRILATIDLIEAKYDGPLSLDDMARAAGMSRFHFSRRFREVVGKSPYQYLLEIRLAHAAALLRRGHCSVTAAALSCGFNDLGRFSRMFRSWNGRSPDAYRHQSRQPRIAVTKK